MKKKLLFIVNNPIIFRGIVGGELNTLWKKFDITFFISSNVYNQNKKYKIFFFNWLKNLKKKKCIKNFFLIPYPNYYSLKKTIELNLLILKLRKKNYDIIVVSNHFFYWQSFLLSFFSIKKSKILALAYSFPSGLDIFNSYKDFKNSFVQKKIISKNLFQIRFDDEKIKKKFQDSILNIDKKSSYLIDFIKFLKKKILVKLCILVSHHIMPIIFFQFFHQRKIEKKLDLDYSNLDNIGTSSNAIKSLVENIIKKKCNLIKFKPYRSKFILKNYNWIICLHDTNKISLIYLQQLLHNLKKLNKIDKFFIKFSPSWPHGDTTKFINEIKKIKIECSIIESEKNIEYHKFYGIITNPSTVILEAEIHNPKIKIIILKNKLFAVSPLVLKLYKKFYSKYLWNYTYANLKKYLNIKYKEISDNRISFENFLNTKNY
jgi:hypothetical protein